MPRLWDWPLESAKRLLACSRWLLKLKRPLWGCQGTGAPWLGSHGSKDARHLAQMICTCLGASSLKGKSLEIIFAYWYNRRIKKALNSSRLLFTCDEHKLEAGVLDLQIKSSCCRNLAVHAPCKRSTRSLQRHSTPVLLRISSNLYKIRVLARTCTTCMRGSLSLMFDPSPTSRR